MRLKIFLLPISICFCLISCQIFDSKKDIDPSLMTNSFAIPQPTPLANNKKEYLHNICENWYNSMLKNSGFSGGMLVASHGNIVFERYQGFAHMHQKDSLQNRTPLHIASVSKTFTAMAVLKLFQEKKCNLDDELSKYFTNFNYPGVTIKSLLNHRSGLPNYVYFMEELGWQRNEFVKNSDVLNALITQKDKIRNIEKANRHFNYCNTNYVLLALLIEKLSGTTYPNYIKQAIFTPLHMDDSFVYTDIDSIRATPSYDWRQQTAEFMNLDKVYGDKNIFSTPRDLLKWDRLLYTNQFLSDSILTQAYQAYSNEKSGIRNYGLGWRMYDYPNGYKIIYHNGWWHGSNAVFIRLIKEDATIILVGNKYNRNIYRARDLIGAFVEHYTADNAEE